MTYKAILTNNGLAHQANCIANNTPIDIYEIKLGDGNGSEYTPTGAETALKNVVYSNCCYSINRETYNPTNPDSAHTVVINVQLGPDIGSFDIRELGIYVQPTGAAQQLFAIANIPTTRKELNLSVLNITLKLVISTDAQIVYVIDESMYALANNVNNELNVIHTPVYAERVIFVKRSAVTYNNLTLIYKFSKQTFTDKTSFYNVIFSPPKHKVMYNATDVVTNINNVKINGPYGNMSTSTINLITPVTLSSYQYIFNDYQYIVILISNIPETVEPNNLNLMIDVLDFHFVIMRMFTNSTTYLMPKNLERINQELVLFHGSLTSDLNFDVPRFSHLEEKNLGI